jgi:tetratricopeptide (TPR) repeat protein
MSVKSSARSKMTRQKQRDLDVQINFTRGLVQRDPVFVEALQLLGDLCAQRGRHAESLNVDKKLSRLESRNPVAFYNFACSYSLNGQFDHAAMALERALRLGCRDFNWLAKDPDLRKLRKHPLYRVLEGKIRKMNVQIR